MEVLHPDWLANPVLVEKKKDDPNVAIVWRMCIDYTKSLHAAEKKIIHEVVSLAQSAQLGMPRLTNPLTSVAFQASKETKKISIDDTLLDHYTVIIGAGLDKK